MQQIPSLDQLQTTTGRLASFVAEALNIVADAIADIEITDTHIELATNSSNGLMSAEDKAKLDSIELTNNFTSEDKTKLDGIASNAQVNVIETVKVNNTALTVTNKAVNIDLSGYLTTSGKAASATTADSAGNVTGTVAIANGGTGATTAAAALTNLGAAASNHTHSGYAATSHTHGAGDITSGTLSIARGGTGATAVATARQNLFPNAMNTSALAKYVITINDSYVSGGYTTIAQLKSFLGKMDSATVADYPTGFAMRLTSQSWGVQTGTFMTGWTTATSGNFGAITFRKDCPETGKLSAQIDGYFYQNEAQYRCLDESDFVSKVALSTTAQTTEGAIWVSWS